MGGGEWRVEVERGEEEYMAWREVKVVNMVYSVLRIELVHITWQ